MRLIGYSTGAIAKSDLLFAVAFLRSLKVKALEISALRLRELPLVLEAIKALDLADFDYIAFHVPSRFTSSEEEHVVEALTSLRDTSWPLIVHPDIIATPSLWRTFGAQLCIENMDQRKPVGQTSEHLREIFSSLPNATLCLDLAHIQQVDPTMFEAAIILKEHGHRLRQFHMSDLDTFSSHHRISQLSLAAFASVCRNIDQTVPVILESPLLEESGEELVNNPEQALHEMDLARRVFSSPASNPESATSAIGY